MKEIDERPTRGDFGLPDARLIKPGEPWASTLYYRMAKFGRDRMPHIGSERPDEAALQLIERWISGMGGDRPGTGPGDGPAGPSPTDPRSAQVLARKLGRGELEAARRVAVLAEAAK